MPANIAPKARLLLTTPKAAIIAQLAASLGRGRCCTRATKARAAPAISARRAANHSSGASRRPQRTPRKHSPKAPVIHSIRKGAGRRVKAVGGVPAAVTVIRCLDVHVGKSSGRARCSSMCQWVWAALRSPSKSMTFG